MGAFQQGLSKDTGVLSPVPSTNIVQLPPWQRPNDFIPKAVERLSDVLEFDEDGEILTSLEGACQAAEKYLDSLWRLVPDKNGAPKSTPVPWTEVRRSRDNLERFVEPTRLPSETFIFDRPKDLPKNELWKFIDHIIQGESGALSAERIFRWTRQIDGHFEVAPKPRKQTRQAHHKTQKKIKKRRESSVGETIDLDGVGSAAESEPEPEPTKKCAPAVSHGRKVQKEKADGTIPKPKAQTEKAKGNGSKPKRKSRSRGPGEEAPEITRSGTKTGKKAPTRPGSQQSQQGTNPSDVDSDEDIIDELQVLFKGQATQLFVGQHEQVRELAA
ncbi:hypothetical protein M422DRAFT_57080 [Sphaerobolus stellatus SS14]|uniref:Uncharacterized protein n=1 Tax=Sphaerobolus stellatus (strain SS14) TaxID=990650 RepID=A0A0C9U162_SPHS4|nr:hypothetical protein M422DRAFT_57080 [Sphaerobolus stellatus SS14]